VNAVIIGASGHVDYALAGHPSLFGLVGMAPGHPGEDISSVHRQFPKTPIFQDYRSLLKSVRADVAVVNPYYALTGQIALACVQAGMNVLAEKPLALNAKVLLELEETARATNVKVGTMQVHRYEPWFCAAMQALHRGDIGKPLLITAQKSYKIGVKPPWMWAKSQFGGLIPWVGAHALDWLVWAKPLDWHIAGAKMTTVGNKGYGDVESAACLFLAAGDTMAAVHLDYLRPSAANGHGDDRLRMAGENGIIEVRDKQATILNDSGARILEQAPQPSMMEDFMHWVHGRGIFRSGLPQAAQVAALCQQAEKEAQHKPSNTK
jgi:predicted dehydrogenase